MKNRLVAPVVKWVGGKRQLLDELTPLFPKKYTVYCEPFLGGAAVLFSLQPKKAIVNDLNTELIAMYEVIRDYPEELIESLKKHENNEEYFYAMRDIDRDKEVYNSLSKIEKASRLIYLNKTCFNGLFRVNSAGEFNTPFGNYKNPNIVNEPILKAVGKYLKTNDIAFRSTDFSDVLAKLKKGSFVYLDPPYELDKRDIKFMLSNSSTQFIRELYKGYNISFVKAKRAINSNANKRGAVDEVVIRNYGNE